MGSKMSKAILRAENSVLVEQFLSNGGKVKKLKAGTPKDLKRIIRSGWLFGGRRTYNNTLMNRGANIFDGSTVIKPNSLKK